MRRNATLFVLISLLSGFGSTAMTLAASIWILDLSGSVGLAALTGICIYAPTLAAPWLGAVVDRLPRRPLLIWVDVLLGLALLTLLTVHSPGGIGLIFGVLLARGVSYVLLDAGESAILPAALPSSALGAVNGWRSSAQEGAKLVAPLAGAGLYAWGGPLPVVLVSATLPLLTAGCYALVHLRPVTLGETTIHRGPVRVLLRERAVRVPVLVAAVAITLSGLVYAAVLSRVVDGLHRPATHLGFLASAQGAGSIAGGLLVGRLLRRTAGDSAASAADQPASTGPITLAAIGAVVFAAGCVAWCLPWWPALITGSILAGLGLPWTLIAAITAVQTGTPNHLLGRVSATANMVMFGPIALAIPLGSALVQAGARPQLSAAAAIAVTAGALARRGPVQFAWLFAAPGAVRARWRRRTGIGRRPIP